MFAISVAAVLAAAAMFFGTIVLSALLAKRWCGYWRVLATFPLATLVIWGAVITVSIKIHPSAHNLWPLELILWCVSALIFLGITALIRRLLHR